MFLNSSMYNGIEHALNGSVAMDFHKRIALCNRYLYRGLGLDYKQTKQLGGDGGADFIVPSQNLYFAFTSETVTSLKSLLNKINHDITRLTSIVIDGEKYTKKIDRFIFIYNTHTNEKQNDQNNEIPKIFNAIFTKYYKFEYEIWNVEDYIDFLRENANEDIIRLICDEMNFFDYVKSSTALEDVRFLLNKIEDTETTEQSYIRKSTDAKINDSNLKEVHDDIVSILTTSDFYPRLQKVIIDESYNAKFMAARKKIIDLYNHYYTVYKGYELFSKVINSFKEQMFCSYQTSKLLTIYIFDNCDIF